MCAAQRPGVQLPRAHSRKCVQNPTISRAKRSAAMPGWARQAARSPPNGLCRGVCRQLERAERPGMRYNSPGIRYALEVVSTPQACDKAPQACDKIPQAMAASEKQPSDEACDTPPRQWPRVRLSRPARHPPRCPIEPIVMTTLPRLPAQRPAHQPPRARYKNYQNAYDLAREAVGCMGLLAGSLILLLKTTLYLSRYKFPLYQWVYVPPL